MKTPTQLLPALLACLGLAACDSDKATGTMDDTNQSAMARVFLPDHKPAAKAEVLAWRLNDTTAEAAARTETASDGSYSLGVLPDGLYRVVARKGGLVAMQDSMTTVAGRLSPRDDTLRTQAVATGTVKMTGSDNPSTVTILVMGTDVILYNVDKSGSFKLEGLATGTYRLRLSSTNGNYTTTAATIRITAGKTTDVGTIRMNFTGTPPVDSLKARIDTVKNHVVLSWKLPEVRDFRFVRVYREPLDGSEKAQLVGYSTGNTFRDSIANFTGRAIEWLYTVRIHTLDGDSGYPSWVKVSQGNRYAAVLQIRCGLDMASPSYEGDSTAIFLSWIASPDLPRSLVMTYQGVKTTLPIDTSARSNSGPYAYGDSLLVKVPNGSIGYEKKAIFVLTGGDGSTTRDSVSLNVFRNPKDSVFIRDSIRRVDSISAEWRRRMDSIQRADSLAWLDSARRADSTWHDAATGDTTEAPGDTDYIPALFLSSNLWGDTLIAGTRRDLLFTMHSIPYRAKSLSWNWDGSSRDTLLPGAGDSTRRPYAFTDTVRVSLSVGSALGWRMLFATVITVDGRSRTDTIRVFVIAPKSKSVASAPILVPATIAGSAASHEVIARLARKPDPEG